MGMRILAISKNLFEPGNFMHFLGIGKKWKYIIIAMNLIRKELLIEMILY